MATGIDSLAAEHLQDSLRTLKQAFDLLNSQQHTPDYWNYFFGVAGIIGTIITVYTIYQSHKSKKLQDFIYRQAHIALEKESNEQKLFKTKEELTSVEARLTNLQKQIQKDLPIEARRAVLKDRLEESLENLKRYFDDVKATKEKLHNLGEQPNISEDLLKSIQEEIEPRFLLKEKIATYQTFLTVVSTLSGLAFAFLPYPIENYVGGTFLLLGLPIVLLILQLTLVKRSRDKQKTNLWIKLGVSVIGTALTFLSAGFFWLVYATSNREGIDLLSFATIMTFVTMVMVFFNIRLYKKYKLMNRNN